MTGRGARTAPEELVRFLDATGAAYLDTQEGRGLVPPGHPAVVGALRSRVMREADLVVTVGRQLDYQLGFGSPAAFPDARWVRVSDSAGGAARQPARRGRDPRRRREHPRRARHGGRTGSGHHLAGRPAQGTPRTVRRLPRRARRHPARRRRPDAPEPHLRRAERPRPRRRDRRRRRGRPAQLRAARRPVRRPLPRRRRVRLPGRRRPVRDRRGTGEPRPAGDRRHR
ncbi:hypothetical protein [Pseudonocardia sp. Ae150A_Ps1]|uniref:hypothetical protein n=1 Tax=unclassified Pseudonocardia TaxID=2619320 RepID=UPI0032C46063